MILLLSSKNWAVSSAGRAPACTQGVSGSIPLRSTIYLGITARSVILAVFLYFDELLNSSSTGKLLQLKREKFLIDLKFIIN